MTGRPFFYDALASRHRYRYCSFVKEQSSRTLAFRAAFKAGIPVLLGYTSIGFAFGLVLVGLGLPWWLSPLMALFVFAGAAQFLGAGLLAAGSGVVEIAVLTLLMNARHAVYGLSVLDKYACAGRRKPYLIFGLTDETYGIVTTMNPPEGVEPAAFYFALTALNQLWWVLGCTLGGAFGAVLPFDTAGLDFAMTALFVVLLVEQARSVRKAGPFVLAAGASVAAFVLAGPDNFILTATALSAGGLLVARKRIEAPEKRAAP